MMNGRGEDPNRAFEAMFRRDYPKVVASVRWLNRDGGAAEEVAQEAFCRALERWGRVRRYDNPGAWVQVTALRLAYRRHGRRSKGLGVLEAGLPLAVAERDLDLHAAISALPERQRATIVLHYLLDLGVDDVARVLGVSAGTVKTQLHRARLRLAELLEDPEVVDGGR